MTSTSSEDRRRRENRKETPCVRWYPSWEMVLAAVLMLVGAGCAVLEESQVPPDERFSHRYEEQGPEGHRTLRTTPPEPGATYFFYPVPVREIIIRKGPPADTADVEGAVPVELLLLGTLPDPCMELHEVEQERRGRIIDVRFIMRRPRGATCRPLRRPYRFYLPLDGLFPPGDYTLRLNDQVEAFEVR